MPKEMIIEKNVVINKNIDVVFNYLRQTRNQDNFSVCNMKDPQHEKTYSAADGTKGFIYSWHSKDKNVGAGPQEITNIIVDNSGIDYTLRFEQPMKNTGISSFILNKIDDGNLLLAGTLQVQLNFPFLYFHPFLEICWVSK